jgi:hypothetical protein
MLGRDKNLVCAVFGSAHTEGPRKSGPFMSAGDFVMAAKTDGPVSGHELIGCDWTAWLDEPSTRGAPVGRGQQFRIGTPPTRTTGGSEGLAGGDRRLRARDRYSDRARYG